MIQYKDDMLLFCMERPASRHALYFVELNTLREPMPRIHRYFCTARQFETFSLGGCYQLDLRGLQLVRAALETEYDIEDTYFALLMELREMRFGDPARARTFDPGRYYTFEEMRSLIQYREPLYWRAALAVARIPPICPPCSCRWACTSGLSLPWSRLLGPCRPLRGAPRPARPAPVHVGALRSGRSVHAAPPHLPLWYAAPAHAPPRRRAQSHAARR